MVTQAIEPSGIQDTTRGVPANTKTLTEVVQQDLPCTECPFYMQTCHNRCDVVKEGVQ